MNQSTQPPVEVTAEDREAAADIGRYVFFSDLVADGILEGRHSGNDLVQAFARHRIAALNTRADDGGEPLAWRYDPPKGLMDAGAPPVLRLYRDPHMSHYGYAGTPLFAHPPAPTTSPDVAALREAAIALRDDMLERARNNAWQNDGDVVVEAGAGVWARFNRALDELETLRAGEK